ncbi:sensor histidine kinase [Acuticoccus kandeliae]|uniref:sensor histidine kinase n=1 Tax=Acuticoccus kandeliae TaxID=2073160 RepID=UPI000D3EAD1F|nr:ATP-binding protein [Acuticoccus kandeliae]
MSEPRTAPRSTPLRLASTLIVIFFLFSLAGYGASYFITRELLTGDVDARLQQIVDELRSIPEEDERAERVAEIAGAADPAEILVRYAGPDGAAAIGNLTAPVRLSPGAIVRHGDLPLPEAALADTYVGWQGPAGRGTLTVLVSRDSLDELGETFAKVLLFSLVPALILATLVGALVARSARDRVETIRTALARLTSGETGARVALPPGGEADDLGQIALAVNRMADAQEASIEAMRQVSADIAHDLKTPIQRVAVLLDRLDGEPLADAARETIEAARAETAQIVATFQSLLQIAQLESGQARSGFKDVDLVALVADLVDVYEPAVEASGHRLRLTTAGPAMVKGERTLLGRLVANLIENALRHTPGGAITLSVTGGERPTLVVRDQGPGIPEAERGKVLRRLYRLERSRTSEGSGLGLALVSAIADLHGATLTLGDAEPGLLVTIAFPPV